MDHPILPAAALNLYTSLCHWYFCLISSEARVRVSRRKNLSRLPSTLATPAAGIAHRADRLAIAQGDIKAAGAAAEQKRAEVEAEAKDRR